MTTTTYYNLNIVEGTDIVNPLIVDNPNYEKIDETMHNNAVAGVTIATEIANATVHAITRDNSDCAVIRFIATSEWKAGDTATVDGVPVTALLPSGETLPDGAYVINANVLCILTGTNLTVFAERKKTDDASEISYNGTSVSMELDKLNNNLKWKYHGATTGDTALALPSDFTELKITSIFTQNESEISVTVNILRADLSDSVTRYFEVGNMDTRVEVGARTSLIVLSVCQKDGTDFLSSTYTKCYYR